MFKNAMMVALGLSVAGLAQAETTPIQGTVQSKCIIQTDSAGVFGNPNAYTLTTDPSDGGQPAVIRFDVSLADAYYAVITTPSEFSSSPSLPDTVTWTGEAEVAAVSDASGMGTYETDKVEYGMTDKYDLTATGSTWFKVSAEATMGGDKSFPGGDYTALVVAECIAQ